MAKGPNICAVKHGMQAMGEFHPPVHLVQTAKSKQHHTLLRKTESHSAGLLSVSSGIGSKLMIN